MESVDNVHVPDGFLAARAVIRQALVDCERASLPSEAVLTVLLSELMPRLLEAHGPNGVATVLRLLGDQLASGAVNQLRQ